MSEAEVKAPVGEPKQEQEVAAASMIAAAPAADANVEKKEVLLQEQPAGGQQKSSAPATANEAAPKIVERTAVAELRSAVPEGKEDNLTYVFQDMTAFDITPFERKTTLGLVTGSGEGEREGSSGGASSFLAKTRDNVQLLVNKLFTVLPQESHETGTVGILRGHFDSPKEAYRLPRQKPVPKKKEMTRWEKFAKERGIEKKKRPKMVWDETVGGWSRRYGYKSVKQNAENAQWCMEVKEGADPTEDPFKKQKAEKKLDQAKQKLREMRNKVEQAGFKLAPVSLEKTGVNEGANSKRGKEGLHEALKRAQPSSGSRGKFDRKAKDESTVKKRGGKKKLISGSSGGGGGNASATETAAVLKTFERVDRDGGLGKKVKASSGGGGGKPARGGGAVRKSGGKGGGRKGGKGRKK
eukprot:g9874.t1